MIAPTGWGWASMHTASSLSDLALLHLAHAASTALRRSAIWRAAAAVIAGVCGDRRLKEPPPARLPPPVVANVKALT